MNEKECEKINFWELIEKYKICIPKIQRDYAQGRKNEKTKEIRENLLNDIYDTIFGDKDELELDFIYGRIIKKENSKNNEYELHLLDGQQRITTLFLLYWYFAKRAKQLDNEEIKTRFKNFSYNNRKNAEEFCKRLIDKSDEIKIESLLENKEQQENELSRYIKNKLWFLVDWNNEPTIVGMLNMLDEIHRIFKNSNIDEYIFAKITKENIITLYLLDTEKYNLPDELYIKMNSRGKDLFEYDRVKEKMISIIKKIAPNLLEEFNKNIETKWNDFFFDYYNKKIDLNDLDNSLASLNNEEFLNLYYYITEMIYICYIATEDEIKNNKNNASPFDKNNRFKYIEKTYINIENIRLLFDILNLMESKEKVNEYMQIYTQIPMFFIKKKNYNIIDRIINGEENLGVDEKEITFFYLIRLINKNDNNQEFIRMMRNLSQKNRFFNGNQKEYTLNPRYYGIKKDYEILKSVITSNDCYKALNDIEIKDVEGFRNFKEENIADEKEKYNNIENENVNYIENLDFIKGNIRNFKFLINESKENINRFRTKIEENIILTYMYMLKYNSNWIRTEANFTYIGNKKSLYDTFTNNEINDDFFKKFYDKLKEIKFDFSKLKEVEDYKENDVYYYFAKYPEIWENIETNNILWFRKYDEIKINWYRSSKASGKHINIFLNAIAKRNNYEIIETTEINESGIIKIDENNHIEIYMDTDNVEDYEIVIDTYGKKQRIKIDLNKDYIEQIENAIKKYMITK